MTGIPTPLVELGLIPFTPSREQAVANLDTIFFDLEKKRIVRRKEKRMKMGDQPVAVMVTEKTIMHRIDEDPRLLAMEGIEVGQDNAVNVGKMAGDTEQY